MKNLLLCCCFLLFIQATQAQQKGADSAQVLQQVVVHAFEQNRQLQESSAAVNVIDAQALGRFNTTSLLPALNSTPGVHMEERSPGSYRLNIRGSTLRSPFGVRNVKIYWNDIPFTDPGGNTYLNQLSFFDASSIEVIKGPAGSLYGAGTGGAMLISTMPEQWTPGLDLHYTTGSFNQQTIHAAARFGSDNSRNLVSYTHQTSDGYRDHTRMRRDLASWQSRMVANERQQITASFLYGDLYYQTPGGLTAAQAATNPRQSRPGADNVAAAIYQKMFLAGITHQYQLSDHWDNKTTVYGAYTQVKNPTFLNYEKRNEPHFGGRTLFTLKENIFKTTLQLTAGAELQKGLFDSRVFGNQGGRPDTVQTDDETNTLAWSVFTQADLQFPKDWTLTAGVSINRSSIAIDRLSVPGSSVQKRTYQNEWAPRIALSKKIIPQLLVYASYARGFSPPTTSEVLPSTGNISTYLEAEQGNNYEVGVKSNWLQSRLYIEVNTFLLQLENTIVQQRDANNADYFINAGSTRQQGIESQLTYRVLARPAGFWKDIRVWVSHTWNRFRYHSFDKNGTDYSGNAMPGVAPHMVAAGVDIATTPGFYAHLTYYYSDRIVLDDANTVYAGSYNLPAAKIGYQKELCRKLQLDVAAGVDNLFNVSYSLGNDINAFGGRYFNPAPGINYYANTRLSYRF